MSLLEAFILGVVQGITEFLPISSTAHLRVIPALVGWGDPGAAFSAVIQLGTTAAVILYFAKDLWRIARAMLDGVKQKAPMGTVDARLGWFVAVGTIPIVILGLALKKYVEREFRSLYVIAFAAIGLAIVLFVAERVARHRRKVEDLNMKDAVAIGLAQCVALIPGSSRSGTTMTMALLLDLEREAAARFSFLLSIPATAAAGVFELKHLVEGMKAGDDSGILALVVGTVSAFVAGYVSIAWLLRFLRTRTMLVFIVYRVALGGWLLVLLWRGMLAP